MNLYIWNEILNEGSLTDAYHDGGGAVVVAKSEEDAKRVLSAEAHDLGVEQIPSADHVFRLADDYDEQCFIFPDAGCC